eukprot:15701379-Heterocapsa_arctica.AAC.1
MVQTICGQIRALRLDVERLWSVKLTTRSAILPWIVSHAAFLYNRYQPYRGGATPYERVQKHAYRSAILNFGEPVMVRKPDVAK